MKQNQLFLGTLILSYVLHNLADIWDPMLTELFQKSLFELSCSVYNIVVLNKHLLTQSDSVSIIQLYPPWTFRIYLL